MPESQRLTHHKRRSPQGNTPDTNHYVTSNPHFFAVAAQRSERNQRHESRSQCGSQSQHGWWNEVWKDPQNRRRPHSVASDVMVRSEVHVGSLTPDDVNVELYLGRVNSSGEIVEGTAINNAFRGPARQRLPIRGDQLDRAQRTARIHDSGAPKSSRSCACISAWPNLLGRSKATGGYGWITRHK
jgi:hypothetical protein